MEPFSKTINIILSSALILVGCSPILPTVKLPTSTIQTDQTGTVTPTIKPFQTLIPESTPTPSSAPGIEFSTSDAKGQKVIFWHPWVGKRGKIIEQMALEYNLSNPYDIQVEPRDWGGEDALVGGLSSSIQDPPSLVVLPPEYRIAFEQQGLSFLDLADYINQTSAEIGMTGIQDYPDTLLQPVKTETKLFGLPASGDTRVMIYNKTWGKILGFDQAPTNWDGFVEQACAAAQVNNKLSDRRLRGTGGWLIDRSPESALGWIHAFGAPVPYTSEVKTTYSSPAYQKVFSQLLSLRLNGCAWVGKNPNSDFYFSDRLALFITTRLSDAESFGKSMTATKTMDQWEILSFPGNVGSDNWLAEMDYYFIPSTDNNQQLASWLFLKWISAPEQELRLSLSDGLLPARKITWDVVLKANQFPTQQVEWMTKTPNPLSSPYQPEWLIGKAVLADGFRQIMESSSTEENLSEILAGMDSFAQELENK